MMKGMFETLITLVVGLALLPVVNGFVSDAKINATGTESGLLGLIPFLWILAIVGVAVGLGIYSYKHGK